MAILFFTSKYADGSGDVVQAVKVADFVEDLLRSKKIETDIIIVVPDATKTDHRAVVKRFLDNDRIRVQTLSEFRSNMPEIDCCIEMAYGAQFWREPLKAIVEKEKIPCIYMPEYDNSLAPDNAPTILGGFDKEKGDVGVIPTKKLLDATADDSRLPEEIAKAFNQLDPKLKKYLGLNTESYLKYRQSHDFSYQYSHDRTKYSSLDKNDKVICQHTPVQFFLLEHIALTSQSPHSQDVLCLGGGKKTKKQALLALKNVLIENGYTKITFVDTDKDENNEDVLHNDTSSSPAKEYRVLYSSHVPLSTMQTLPLLANDFVGATGDQSLVEAMSAGKLVTYECIGHKKNFAIGYLKAVNKETDDERVQLLAKLLIKVNVRADAIQGYEPTQIMALLKDKSVVDALKKINRKLVAESRYFKAVEDMILPRITPFQAQAILQLSTLSDNLLKAVKENKNDSPYWKARQAAADKIIKQIQNKEQLTLADARCIQKQLAIIKANKPLWDEFPLISKLLTIVSFGIIPAIQYRFFSDDTTKYMHKFDNTLNSSLSN